MNYNSSILKKKFRIIAIETDSKYYTIENNTAARFTRV